MSEELSQSGAGLQSQRHDAAEQLVARAENLLWRHTRPADAAGTYAQALQLEPDLVSAHLGMAEANLALGGFTIARNAATYVMQLVPGSSDAQIAQAIILVIDHNYQGALDQLETVIHANPGRPYPHALRGYCLRSLRRDYDGALADAKAARLASAPDVRSLFPRVDPQPARPAVVAGSDLATPTPRYAPSAQPSAPYRQRTPVQNQMTRMIFYSRQYPIGTYSIIAICVVVFLAQLGTNVDSGVVTSGGILDTSAVLQQGQWYRLLTAMFLHANLLHIAGNMLSLYFIGPYVERIFGLAKFLLIYFVSGVIGNVVFLYAVGPGNGALGASGAIAGIFGALLIFFIINRQRMGPVGNSILGQLLFWLMINVGLNVYAASGLAWQAHLGGILAGALLGAILPSAIRN